MQSDRVPAPSHGVGSEEELSCFVIRRHLSGFRKLWHPVGGRMQGQGQGWVSAI